MSMRKKGRLRQRPGAVVAGFAGDFDVDVEDVVLVGGVDGEGHFLDDAEVVGGEPDSCGEAADGALCGGLGEGVDGVGGEAAGAGLGGGDEEFGDEGADAFGGGFVDGEGEVDSEEVADGLGEFPVALEGGGGDAGGGAGGPECGEHDDAEDHAHGDDGGDGGVVEGDVGEEVGPRQNRGEALAEDISGDDADGAEGRSFCEEEHADVGGGEADGGVDVDFAAAFGDGAEHGVEDDHATDEHGDEDVAEVARGEGGGGVDGVDGVGVGDVHGEGGLFGEEFGEEVDRGRVERLGGCRPGLEAWGLLVRMQSALGSVVGGGDGRWCGSLPIQRGVGSVMEVRRALSCWARAGGDDGDGLGGEEAVGGFGGRWRRRRDWCCRRGGARIDGGDGVGGELAEAARRLAGEKKPATLRGWPRIWTGVAFGEAGEGCRGRWRGGASRGPECSESWSKPGRTLAMGWAGSVVRWGRGRRGH